MGFNKSEVANCLMMTKNVPAAMILYIMRNGCGEFKCRKCPLTLVCDHYPAHSKDYAFAVYKKVVEKM